MPTGARAESPQVSEGLGSECATHGRSGLASKHVGHEERLSSADRELGNTVTDNTKMHLITCQCGQKMKVPEELIGKACKCVKCGAKLRVTHENVTPVQGPAPQGYTASKGPDKPSVGGPARKRIGELLIEEGLITEAQLHQALAVQAERGGKTFEILIALGHLSKDRLHDFLSKQSGVASINLKNYVIPKDLVSLVPREMAQKNLVIPIDRLGKLLTAGMACPLDDATIAELETVTGLRVKPMLCRLDDILAAIERYYPIAQKPEAPAPAPPVSEMPPQPPIPTLSFPRREALNRLTQIDSLATFSDTVQQVRKAIERPDGSLRDVAEIVSRDPPVLAKLLSVANAAVYGMPGHVNDVYLAAVLLGIDGLCEIVMSTKIAGAIHDRPQFDYASFSTDSLACARAARNVARTINGELQTPAYTAGLLHDIGRLALAEAFPELYGRIPNHVAGPELLQAEEGIFGLAHPEAGYVIAKEWRLPAGIVETIRLHHQPESATEAKELVQVVALAAHLTEARHHAEDLNHAIARVEPLVVALGLDRVTVLHSLEEASAQMARP